MVYDVFFVSHFWSRYYTYIICFLKPDILSTNILCHRSNHLQIYCVKIYTHTIITIHRFHYKLMCFLWIYDPNIRSYSCFEPMTRITVFFNSVFQNTLSAWILCTISYIRESWGARCNANNVWADIYSWFWTPI